MNWWNWGWLFLWIHIELCMLAVNFDLFMICVSFPVKVLKVGSLWVHRIGPWTIFWGWWMMAWDAWQTWWNENHTDRAIEVDFFSTTPEENWREDQGMRDCVAEKGMTSLCWVCVGVLKSRLVLVLVSAALQWAHQLSISLSPAPVRLINPTVLAWMNCVPLLCCYSLLCVSLLVPYSLGSHALLRGVGIAERFRSVLAYGWVERYSDVASCGMSSL